MKKERILLMVLAMLLTLTIYGQNQVSYPEVTDHTFYYEVSSDVVYEDQAGTVDYPEAGDKTASAAEKQELSKDIKVQVNEEMIRRFNDYEPENDYPTIWDILKSYNFDAVREAYVAYQFYPVMEDGTFELTDIY